MNWNSPALAIPCVGLLGTGIRLYFYCNYPLLVCTRYWYPIIPQIDEYSNRVANLMVSEGYKHGDTVALFMMNQPEYVCIWLGCAKVKITHLDI